MKEYLQLIDTNTTGPRCDITPLFVDARAFSALLADLSAPFLERTFDYVAGIDALGFILGTALAVKLNKGFIAVRKKGKLPVHADVAEFVDYTGQKKALELRPDAIAEGNKILLVDEWIETGAQVSAAIELIERQGGIIIGIVSINIDDNPRTRTLKEKYHCHAVWHNMETL